MIDFATAAKPIRMSRLPSIVLCTWKAAAEELAMIDRGESGRAADTGSAAHLAIATWHQNGGKLADALDAMRAASAAFPLFDPKDAEMFVRPYTLDPRNRDAEIEAIEQKVTLRLEPKYIEGSEIVVTGTLDQIRVNQQTGDREVWDIKSGDRSGQYFQNHYALQLAGYTVAASQCSDDWRNISELYPRVAAGGYIRLKGYRTRGAKMPDPDGVFVPGDIPDPDALLDAVRWAVCMIRSGYYVATPGVHCENCSFASHSFCVPKLKGRVA